MQEIKTCNKCFKEKLKNEFSNKSNCCKKCKSEYDKIYKKLNKDKVRKEYKRNIDQYKKRNKEYHTSEINKFYNLKNREKNKEWFQLNKKRILKNIKKKYKEDLNFKLVHSLRTRFYQSLKKGVKFKSIIKLLDCSIEDCKKYLESKFTPEMTWDNHGKIWEIDHIIPCIKFDLSKLEEQKKCFSYKNLQPLFKTTEIAESFGYKNIIGNRNKPKK